MINPYSNISQHEAALELVRRKAARQHLLAFTRYTKADYAVNWHHRVLADVLTKVVRGITPDPGGITPTNPYGVLEPLAPKRVIICLPPRNGKSELASRRLPAFALGLNPDLEIIATSHTADLASLINRDVQDILDADSYKRLFPETQLNSKNIRSVAHGSYLRNNEIFEVVGKHGRYKCAGVSGPLTGMGAMLGICDDPIKNREEADSETYRERLWRWFTSTFMSRFDSPNAAVVVILTRWHEDDLAGRLLKLAREDSHAEKWLLVSLPALLDHIPDPVVEPDQYASYVQFDQRTEVNIPLWPGKFPLVALQRIKAYNADDFEALQQQRPVKPGGTLFPVAKFVYIDPTVFRVTPDMLFVRGWDKAGTEGSGAYTAGVLMCYDPQRRYGVDFIVVDVQRIQYELAQREALIHNTAVRDTHYGFVHHVLEQEPGASGKDSALYTLRNALKGFDAEAIPASGQGDKVTRWKPFASQVKVGNVGLLVADWNAAYKTELQALPFGRYKDQADASALAFNRVSLGWQQEYLAVVDSYEEISAY